MDGVTVVGQIVQILVAGITGLGQGIGAGISDFVSSLAFVTVGEGASATTTMSPYFILLCVFGAIALAVGLTRLIFNWLSSLGGRN